MASTACNALNASHLVSQQRRSAESLKPSRLLELGFEMRAPDLQPGDSFMPARYYAVTKLGGYWMPFEYSERHGFIPSCGNAQAPSSRPTAAEGQDTEAGGPDRRELL